jgi:hypothetical protein
MSSDSAGAEQGHLDAMSLQATRQPCQAMGLKVR